MTTTYPPFYDAAPRLRMRDPLGAFLGATADGTIEYGYADVVKLAGHSCPTAAGAYLMTVHALRRLYGRETPVRGDIEVFLPGRPADGVTGVVANIVAFLTGAAQEGGFKGIGGRFDRRNLLHFGAPVEGQIGFRRRDTGAAVQASFDAGSVPGSPETQGLIGRTLSGAASEAEAKRFRDLWQERLRRLLVEHADDPRLVAVSPWSAPIALPAA